MFIDDLADTPLARVELRGFVRVNNRVKPGLLAPEDLAVLVNGRMDDTGQIDLRPGSTRLAQPESAPLRGLAYYDVPSAEALLAIVNGSIYELASLAPGMVPTKIPGAVLGAMGACEGAQLVDKLAITDGLRLLGLWRSGGQWQTMQVATFTNGEALPPVQHLLSHAFRLFIAGGTGAQADTIYPSDTIEPWRYVRSNGQRIGRGEGDGIVALRPGPNQSVYALKAGSCWRLDTTGEVNQWQIDAISHHTGCWAGATAMVVNQDVIFLSRQGVVALSRLQNDAPTAAVDILSAPIEATIRRINWTAARRTACATLWGAYYLLAVPLDGAHRNNAVLAFNTRTNCWSGEWTGWAPTCWCTTQFDGETTTVVGEQDGTIRVVDPTRMTDQQADGSEAAIPLELETGAQTFGAADLWKLPHLLDAEWRNGSATVDVSLRCDGGTPQTIAEDFDAHAEAGTVNQRLIANLRELGGGRELQVRMVTTGGAFGLREITLKALPLRARWQAPPAELLVPPVPADDTPGTPTTLIQADGSTTTLALQEIDTITLPHDSLDFVCFRGGLTVPAGSYVIAYRRGSFEKYVAPEVSDLPAPTGLVATGGIETITAAWDAAADPRVVGWTVYVDGVRTLDAATPSYAAAVPGGGTVALAIFSRAADGTLSATAATTSVVAAAVPPLYPEQPQWMVVDDFTRPGDGGIGWAAIGTSTERTTFLALDEMDGATATGWASAPTSTIYGP